MKKSTVKIALVFSTLLLSALARAADAPNEIYQIEGKNFTSKAAAIRYVVQLGKPVTILHTRCEIMTNKLTFKACPKNKGTTFENQQFVSLKASE